MISHCTSTVYTVHKQYICNTVCSFVTYIFLYNIKFKKNPAGDFSVYYDISVGAVLDTATTMITTTAATTRITTTTTPVESKCS